MISNRGKIREVARRLTGDANGSQFPDSMYNDIINDFYVNILPTEVSSGMFDSYLQLDTAVGVVSYYPYALQMYKSLFAPAYVNDQPVQFYTDPEMFRARYSEDDRYFGPRGLPPGVIDDNVNRYERPEALLYFGNTISLPRPADSIYRIKISAYCTPPPMTLDVHTPLRVDMCLPIAYGAAIEILNRRGDFEGAASISPTYRYYLKIVKNSSLMETANAPMQRAF